MARAPVHVQWDPERSPRGAALNHYSIQVGIWSARSPVTGSSASPTSPPGCARPRPCCRPGMPPRRMGCFLRSVSIPCPRQWSTPSRQGDDGGPRSFPTLPRTTIPTEPQGAGGPGTAQCPTVPRTVGHPVARFLRRRRTSRPARPRRTPRRR
ncbi:DUF4291 family protein [Streptomyces anulatus]|uniref:DUF4291 family protein n=1 Tax=Streptomyces anulatus TaxID=1892 RepID=UPI00364F63AA